MQITCAEIYETEFRTTFHIVSVPFKLGRIYSCQKARKYV